MSKEGRSKVGGATCVDQSVPYSTIARRERSRKLAQRRRDTYKTIMDDLTGVLPFPNDAISQLDYNSRLRLALCFLRLKTMVDGEGDKVSSVSSKTGRTASSSSGKQIVKRKAVHSGKPVLLQPGMLQELMCEALDGFLMVIQVDGTVVFLSEGIHRHLGLFQSEYIGMTVYDLILEEDHNNIRSKISEAEAKSLTRTTRLDFVSYWGTRRRTLLEALHLLSMYHHEDTEATLQCSRGVMARGEGLSGYYRFLSHFGEYI